LDALAKEHDLTRERIRQIVKDIWVRIDRMSRLRNAFADAGFDIDSKVKTTRRMAGGFYIVGLHNESGRRAAFVSSPYILCMLLVIQSALLVVHPLRQYIVTRIENWLPASPVTVVFMAVLAAVFLISLLVCVYWLAVFCYRLRPKGVLSILEGWQRLREAAFPLPRCEALRGVAATDDGPEYSRGGSPERKRGAGALPRKEPPAQRGKSAAAASNATLPVEPVMLHRQGGFFDVRWQGIVVCAFACLGVSALDNEMIIFAILFLPVTCFTLLSMVVVHRFGHFITAKKLGAKGVKWRKLIWFKIDLGIHFDEEDPHREEKELKVAVTAVKVNIIFTIAFGFLFIIVHLITQSIYKYYLLAFFFGHLFIAFGDKVFCATRDTMKISRLSRNRAALRRNPKDTLSAEQIYEWYKDMRLGEHAKELYESGVSHIEIKNRLKNLIRARFIKLLSEIPEGSVKFLGAGTTFIAFEIADTGLVIKIPILGTEYFGYIEKNLRETRLKFGDRLAGTVEYIDNIKINLSKFDTGAKRFLLERIGKVDNKFSTGILDKLDASGELSEYFREKLQMAPRAENRRPVLAEDLDFTVDGKNTEAAQKEFLKEFIRERSLKPPYSIANDFGERISKGVHQVDALAQVLGKNDLMLEAGRDAQRCGYLPHIIAEALSVIPATVLKSLRQAGLKTIKIAEASAGDALLHYERGVLFIQGQAIKVLSQDEFAAELYTNIGRIFLASLPQSKIEGLSRDFKMIKMRGSALKRESESLGYSFIEVEEEEELTDYLLRLLTYYILTGERLREVVNGDAAFSATYATIRPSIRRIYDLFKFSFEWKEYTSFDFIGFRTALAKARKKSSKVSGKKTKGGITIIRSIASQLADYADVLGTTHDQEDRQWLMIEDSIFAKLKALAAIDTRGLKRLEKAKLPYRVKSFKCVKDVISCFPPSETYELWEQALLEDKKGTFIANMEKHFLHELLIEIDRILNRHAMRPFLNSEQQSLLSEQRERLFFLACRCSRGSATLKNDIIFATGNLKKFGLPEIGFGYEKEGELIKGTASLPAERSVNAPPYASDALRATLSRNLRCPSTPSIFDNTIEEPGAAVGAKREGWQAQTQSSRALFRPDPDSVRFYYKKASGQFRRAYFIKKALHFIYNFLLVHFFDIDDNNSFRAFDVETDDVARVFIKSKQNPRMFYTEGESVKIWVSAIPKPEDHGLRPWVNGRSGRRPTGAHRVGTTGFTRGAPVHPWGSS